jgi:progressive ankylosis protein
VTVTPTSQRVILLFWLPLALQWVMMALEGPFLAAIIARMDDPTYNLAAYGVAFAFAILVESPVIMLMSASTALVEDAQSYRRLRNFATALNAGSTLLLLFVLVPPVYDTLMRTLIGLPAPVADLVYGSLWLLLPWPAAIGYRRFLHGVMIRSGRTRLVAYGTMLRLMGMAATGFLLFRHGSLPGAWVGAAALSAGVVVEAVAARFMAAGAVRELDETPAGEVDGAAVARDIGNARVARGATAGTAAGRTAALDRAGDRSTPGYRDIARFYYPLALTSFIGLTVHPMLTFFMGRSPSPVESLAVFPVVHALSFLFRALGFSYQEASIALLGRRCEHVGILARFGVAMALTASGGMALVAFTPLADVWFTGVSGLTPELAQFAVSAARILVPLPAMSVLLALQQAILVQGRSTRAVSLATALEVVCIAALFSLFGWRLGMTGVNAAMLALLLGRLAGNAYLAWPVRRVLRASRAGAGA